MDKPAVFYLTRTPSGKRTRRAVDLTPYVEKYSSARDVVNYLIKSLGLKMPSLILFTLKNESVFNVAKYLKRGLTASASSCNIYIYSISRFSRWLKMEPDEVVEWLRNNRKRADPDRLYDLSCKLDDWIGELQSEGLAPSSICNFVKSVKTWIRVNLRAELTLPYRLKRRIKYRDRAPTQKELCKLIDLADLRGKVIVSMLALGGFRVGTLVKLKYYHVKEDLEAGRIPVHIHVEAEITKGKYADYDTFIGQEAVEYLKAYLDKRRRGSLRRDGSGIPPEVIHDESPLIRNARLREVKPVTSRHISDYIHKLYIEAGLIKPSNGKMCTLRTHSIRKFFRTQLAALGVERDYIEYMMGHKISTYHDIKMKGVEFLRNIYAAVDLRIRPKEKADIYDFVEDILKSRNYFVNRELLRKAIVKPHRTVFAEDRKALIREAFMEMLRKELLDPEDER